MRGFGRSLIFNRRFFIPYRISILISNAIKLLSTHDILNSIKNPTLKGRISYIAPEDYQMAGLVRTSSFGVVQGVKANGVTAFLGIKYATLKNRFAEPEIIERRIEGVLDATQDGWVLDHPSAFCTNERPIQTRCSIYSGRMRSRIQIDSAQPSQEGAFSI